MLECTFYNGIRQTRLTKFAVKYNRFTKEEQLKLILGCNDEILVKDCAKACHDVLVTRRHNTKSDILVTIHVYKTTSVWYYTFFVSQWVYVDL